MKFRARRAAAISLATAISSFALSAFALPACGDFATNPAYGLAGNPQVSNLTAALQAAGGGSTPYCRVDFIFSGESGPAAGYLPGQAQRLVIRVGLPPNSVDMTNPIAAGAVAWNGKNRDLGGGGYQGAVGSVTSSTNLGYVGTSTDTGHTGGSGSFALNPDGTLNIGLIEDFASDGIHEQHVWGVQLAQTYYGSAPTRKYWMGCSTGGRQGHYQAQNFPKDLDGILAGANAYNWDRFITAEIWPQVVMNQWVGHPIATAKLNAVTAAAVAACDPLDGITDGLVQDPRACTYSAKSFVCTTYGGPSIDPNCLNPQEALTVNKIWDGPRDAQHNLEWYGLDRGASLSGGLAGTNPFSIATDHLRYWIHQDPNFDWHTLTEASFTTDFLTSISKFNDIIGTDDDLNAFRAAGGKMLTYHGLSDQLIFSRGTYHYYNTIAQGNYAGTQTFYRFFPFPGNAHCGGGTGPQINAEALFQTLVNWVESGVAPDFVVASQSLGGGVTRTRKICMYPNVAVYNGSGSTDDQASFTCQVQNSDPLSGTLTLGPQYETSTKANTDQSPD
jgi:Tannase and feruloyl esterase